MSEPSLSSYFKVAPDVWGIKDFFVNMYLIFDPVSKNWVLVDAGLKASSNKIKKFAEELFGPNTKPAAIILTHGHFDHIGSLRSLAEEWSIPIYCHFLEFPYLTGQSDYPPPDPTVGGGIMAYLSWMYPKSPIDVRRWLHPLPQEGAVPFLPEWAFIHTPGHAPGHISLFREKDKLLISGDAIITTKQESALAVLLQKKFLLGPPKYFTYDWKAAEHSVQKLAALSPLIIASGHGKPISGEELKKKLDELVNHFKENSLPNKGRYLKEAAQVNEQGVVHLPPSPISTYVWAFVGLLAALVLVWLIFL